MRQSLATDAFLDTLAAGEPTPGGGSAAALAGAMGAALAAMVARLTLGRPRYREVEGQMEAILAEAETLRERLTQLVVEDAEAYNQVRQAYRLAKDTSESQARRQTAIQAALQGASRTPLRTVAACREVLLLVERAADLGNPNARTDACVGALLAHAGLQGAVLNVRTNLTDIEDAQFIAEATAAVDGALAEADTLLEQTLRVAGQLAQAKVRSL